MTSRPLDLPDFDAPPVSEVSLGVQFNSLDRLLAPHLGLIWAEFKDRFPNIEQHAPLEPVFETFTEKGSAAPVPRPQFQIMQTFPPPRVFFINREKTELLQVQRDRFHHNWRKVGEGDKYPRFERMLETFESGFQKLEAFVSAEGLGTVEPNQAEVTYVNHIAVPLGHSSYEVFEQIFESCGRSFVLPDLKEPEDARFLLRYVVPDSKGAPIGRLIVTTEPAWRLDGTHVIQLTLQARGKPTTTGGAGVREFLQIGRNHIVRAFTDLTVGKMHAVWGRKQ